MTKYQVVARDNHGNKISVGDPHEFMSLAEIHAEELRDSMSMVSSARNVQISVESV